MFEIDEDLDAVDVESFQPHVTVPSLKMKL